MFYKSLIKKNFKDKKFLTFILLFMTMIFCLLLSVSLHLNKESSMFLKQAYTESNQPEVLVAYMNDNYENKYAKSVQNDSNVTKSYTQTYYTGTFLSHGKSKEIIFFSPYTNKDFNRNNIPKLSGNEIMLSSSMKNTYGLHKNQNITLKPGSKKETFQIKGFFKDPTFSSSLSGQTRILVGQSKFNHFAEAFPNNDMAKYKLLSAHVKNGVSNTKDINQVINKLGVLPSNSINYSFTSIQSNLNLIPSVFIIILMALSFFIFISILIVLWYSITVTVNDSKIDFATLLSQGFTKKKIITNYMVKPAVTIFLGGILGIITESYVYGLITGYLSGLTGITWAGQSQPQTAIISTLLIVILLILICLLRFTSIFRVSATDAVQRIQSSKTHHSKFRIKMIKSSPKKLNLELGINKFIGNFKQSSTLFLVITILTFLLTITFGLSNLFSSNTGALKLLGADDGDVILLAKGDKKTMDTRLNKMITGTKDHNKVTYSSLSDHESVDANGQTASATVLDHFNQKNTLLSGTYPKANNEVLISNGLSAKIHKKTNSDLSVSYQGSKKTYKVVGTFNSLDNNGVSIKLSTDAFKRLDKTFIPGQAMINLNGYNEKNITRIINKYDNTSNINVQNGRATYISGVTYVRVISQALVLFIMIITIILSILLLIMLVRLTMIQEAAELETLRTIGFSNKRLKTISLYRFLIIVILGQILGILLAYLLGNGLISGLLNSIGLAGVTISIPLLTIIISSLIVLLFSIGTILLSNTKRN